MKSDKLEQVYNGFVKGLRILPGMWRPHAEWEQVAWVSPPWVEDGYAWLDFPEVIMKDDDFLYAGHGPVGYARVHHDALPKVPWTPIDNGIAFDRVMPGGLAFGGSLTRDGETAVNMELTLRNGTDQPLCGVKMQTCAYLRELHDFDDKTNDNKVVHSPDRGWITLSEAFKMKQGNGKYHLGWRRGPAVADLPYIVTVSSKHERLIAMTWFEDTHSIVGNCMHPCMHTDPAFPDLAPGEQHSIHGKLLFHEGSISSFEKECL